MNGGEMLPTAFDSRQPISGPSPCQQRDKLFKPELRFRRNGVQNGTRTIASQEVGATLLLTRLYEPKAIDALVVFAALYAIVARVFALNCGLSIVRPLENNRAHGLTALTVLISLGFVKSLNRKNASYGVVHTICATRRNLRLKILTCMLPAL